MLKKASFISYSLDVRSPEYEPSRMTIELTDRETGKMITTTINPAFLTLKLLRRLKSELAHLLGKLPDAAPWDPDCKIPVPDSPMGFYELKTPQTFHWYIDHEKRTLTVFTFDTVGYHKKTCALSDLKVETRDPFAVEKEKLYMPLAEQLSAELGCHWRIEGVNEDYKPRVYVKATPQEDYKNFMRGAISIEILTGPLKGLSFTTSYKQSDFREHVRAASMEGWRDMTSEVYTHVIQNRTADLCKQAIVHVTYA